jgi:hypothetical protein
VLNRWSFGKTEQSAGRFGLGWCCFQGGLFVGWPGHSGFVRSLVVVAPLMWSRRDGDRTSGQPLQARTGHEPVAAVASELL